MIGISLRQLEVFATIARTGSVRAAGDALHLSQPAVSMALRELERQLGHALFDRERGRLRLNARGDEYLPLAREVLERVHDLTGLRQADDFLHGNLQVGASNTVGNYWVGNLLGPFISRHPHVNLNMQVDNTGVITRKLLNRELDVACVEGPVHHAQLETWPWREDDLTVCAAPSHPLAAVHALQPQDFAGAHWILRERGSATRQQTEHAIGALPEGHILLELGQIEAIKQAVIAGLGIACLPRIATEDAVAVGRLRILPTPFLNLKRRLSLVLHRSRYRAKLLIAFMDSLELSHGHSSEAATRATPDPDH